MRVLLIGDIVGKPGRQIVSDAVAGLVEREQLDLVIGNGENDYDNALVQALSWRPAGLVSIGPFSAESRARERAETGRHSLASSTHPPA